MKYKGRDLLPIPLILLRLALYPVLCALRCAICLVLLAGWGRDEAARIWGELS